MRSKTCVIFAAGEWCSLDLIQPYLDAHPTVLACDGALTLCLEHGIVPDAVIGDMDSVSSESIERYVAQGGEIHRQDGQDNHDLTKALVFAEDGGCASCVVVGATGGDREHEWANLLSCAAATMNIECLGTEHTYTFFSSGESHSIEISSGQEFSLFALPLAREVTLKGAQYTLEKETLNMGSRGLHNISTASTLHLKYAEGRLMLLKTRLSSRAEEKI